MLLPIDIKTLIEQNYLLNSEVYAFASDLVAVQKFKTKGGDFDTQDLDNFYSSEKMVNNLISAYEKYSLGQKSLEQPIYMSSSVTKGEDLNKAFEETQVGSIMPKFIYKEYQDVRIK